MKRLFPGLGIWVLLAFASLALPSYAQTNAVHEPFVSLKYDISQEVKLSGTITDVVTQPSAGMLMRVPISFSKRLPAALTRSWEDFIWREEMRFTVSPGAMPRAGDRSDEDHQ